jgi:rhodanese-related sulfurtransferase
MRSIVAICGFIGSGKDTIADYLVNFHGYKRESFANSLKDAVSVVFGWDRELLEGRTTQSRLWRETRDEWWSTRLKQDITPRWVLQYWGTEVIRKGFHDNMWVASLEHRLLNSQNNIVITDCRFPNEIKALKKIGATVLRVKRGPEPEWFDDAKSMNKGASRNMNWALSKHRIEELGIHASETAWVGQKFDYLIENDSTVDDLYAKIEDILKVRDQVTLTPS